MLTCTVDNGHIRLRVVLKDGEGRDIVYWTLPRICVNPTCACASLELEFREDGTDELNPDGPRGPCFELDIEEKKLISDVSRLSPKAAFLAGAMVQTLDDQGWKTLYEYHWRLKRAASFQADPSTVDFEFDQEEIAAGNLAGYIDVFHYETLDFPDVDGLHFILDDQYCLNPAHPCATTYLSLIPVDIERHKDLGFEFQSTVQFDYVTGEWKNVDHGPRAPLPQEKWVSLMRDHQPNLLKALKDRHERLRIVYRRFLSKRRITLPIARPAPSRRDRPGPNSPCTCGSGLKYKKCCGKRR